MGDTKRQSAARSKRYRTHKTDGVVGRRESRVRVVTLTARYPLSADVLPMPSANARLFADMDVFNEAETAAQTKIRINDDLVARLKGNHDFERLADTIDPGRGDPSVAVRRLIDGWAKGANSEDARALAAAAGVEFRLPGWERAADDGSGRLGAIRHEAGYRAFVRAMYENTQAWLRARSIHAVVLSRGLSWDKGDEPEGYTWRGESVRGQIRSNELNSFSMNQAETGFANQKRYAMSIDARVPAERILSTAQTGIGAKGEGELIVLGGGEDEVSIMTHDVFHLNGYYEEDDEPQE